MVLIDSSIWIDTLRSGGPEESRRRVGSLLMSGEAAWCPAVRLELWAGIRDDRERRTLSEYASLVTDLPVTDAVWQRAIELTEAGRRKGHSFPYPDRIIFACARVHGVELLHRDRHFDVLAALWQRARK